MNHSARQFHLVGSFPLTPALSLGERENRMQSHSKTCGWTCDTHIRTASECRLLFPLPEGEGQGEGKGAFIYFQRSNFQLP